MAAAIITQVLQLDADCGSEKTNFRLLKFEQTRVGFIGQIQWSQTWQEVAYTKGVRPFFWEANGLSASHRTTRLSWNLRVLYCRQRAAIRTFWTTFIQPTDSHPDSFRSISILSCLLHQGIHNDLLPSVSTTKLCNLRTYFSFIPCVLCVTPISPWFLFVTISSEKNKFWSSSLFSFFLPPTPTLPLCNLFSDTPVYLLSLLYHTSVKWLR